MAATQFACFVALALLSSLCEKGREDGDSARFHAADAGIARGGPLGSGEKGGKAESEDAGKEALEEDAALKEQFTRAAFLACNDPDAALTMMRQIYEQSRPGSALQREAKWFIDQLTASDAGTAIDGGR